MSYNHVANPLFTALASHHEQLLQQYETCYRCFGGGQKGIVFDINRFQRFALSIGAMRAEVLCASSCAAAAALEEKRRQRREDIIDPSRVVMGGGEEEDDDDAANGGNGRGGGGLNNNRGAANTIGGSSTLLTAHTNAPAGSPLKNNKLGIFYNGGGGGGGGASESSPVKKSNSQHRPKPLDGSVSGIDDEEETLEALLLSNTLHISVHPRDVARVFHMTTISPFLASATEFVLCCGLLGRKVMGGDGQDMVYALNVQMRGGAGGGGGGGGGASSSSLSSSPRNHNNRSNNASIRSNSAQKGGRRESKASNNSTTATTSGAAGTQNNNSTNTNAANKAAAVSTSVAVGTEELVSQCIQGLQELGGLVRVWLRRIVKAHGEPSTVALSTPIAAGTAGGALAGYASAPSLLLNSNSALACDTEVARVLWTFGEAIEEMFDRCAKPVAANGKHFPTMKMTPLSVAGSSSASPRAPTTAALAAGSIGTKKNTAAGASNQGGAGSNGDCHDEFAFSPQRRRSTTNTRAFPNTSTAATDGISSSYPHAPAQPADPLLLSSPPPLPTHLMTREGFEVFCTEFMLAPQHVQPSAAMHIFDHVAAIGAQRWAETARLYNLAVRSRVGKAGTITTASSNGVNNSNSPSEQSSPPPPLLLLPASLPDQTIDIESFMEALVHIAWAAVAEDRSDRYLTPQGKLQHLFTTIMAASFITVFDKPLPCADAGEVVPECVVARCSPSVIHMDGEGAKDGDEEGFVEASPDENPNRFMSTTHHTMMMSSAWSDPAARGKGGYKKTAVGTFVDGVGGGSAAVSKPLAAFPPTTTTTPTTAADNPNALSATALTTAASSSVYINVPSSPTIANRASPSTASAATMTPCRLFGEDFGALGRGVWIFDSVTQRIRHIPNYLVSPSECAFMLDVKGRDIMWDRCEMRMGHVPVALFDNADTVKKNDTEGNDEEESLSIVAVASPTDSTAGLTTPHNPNNLSSNSPPRLNTTAIASLTAGEPLLSFRSVDGGISSAAPLSSGNESSSFFCGDGNNNTNNANEVGKSIKTHLPIPNRFQVTFHHSVTLLASKSLHDLPFANPTTNLLTLTRKSATMSLTTEACEAIELVYRDGCSLMSLNSRISRKGWEYVCIKYALLLGGGGGGGGERFGGDERGGGGVVGSEVGALCGMGNHLFLGRQRAAASSSVHPTDGSGRLLTMVMSGSGGRGGGRNNPHGSDTASFGGGGGGVQSLASMSLAGGGGTSIANFGAMSRKNTIAPSLSATFGGGSNRSGGVTIVGGGAKSSSSTTAAGGSNARGGGGVGGVMIDPSLPQRDLRETVLESLFELLATRDAKDPTGKCSLTRVTFTEAIVRIAMMLCGGGSGGGGHDAVSECIIEMLDYDSLAANGGGRQKSVFSEASAGYGYNRSQQHQHHHPVVVSRALSMASSKGFGFGGGGGRGMLPSGASSVGSPHSASASAAATAAARSAALRVASTEAHALTSLKHQHALLKEKMEKAEAVIKSMAETRRDMLEHLYQIRAMVSYTFVGKGGPEADDGFWRNGEGTSRVEVVVRAAMKQAQQQMQIQSKRRESAIAPAMGSSLNVNPLLLMGGGGGLSSHRPSLLALGGGSPPNASSVNPLIDLAMPCPPHLNANIQLQQVYKKHLLDACNRVIDSVATSAEIKLLGRDKELKREAEMDNLIGSSGCDPLDFVLGDDDDEDFDDDDDENNMKTSTTTNSKDKEERRLLKRMRRKPSAIDEFLDVSSDPTRRDEVVPFCIDVMKIRKDIETLLIENEKALRQRMQLGASGLSPRSMGLKKATSVITPTLAAEDVLMAGSSSVNPLMPHIGHSPPTPTPQKNRDTSSPEATTPQDPASMAGTILRLRRQLRQAEEKQEIDRKALQHRTMQLSDQRNDYNKLSAQFTAVKDRLERLEAERVNLLELYAAAKKSNAAAAARASTSTNDDHPSVVVENVAVGSGGGGSKKQLPPSSPRTPTPASNNHQLTPASSPQLSRKPSFSELAAIQRANAVEGSNRRLSGVISEAEKLIGGKESADATITILRETIQIMDREVRAANDRNSAQHEEINLLQAFKTRAEAKTQQAQYLVEALMAKVGGVGGAAKRSNSTMSSVKRKEAAAPSSSTAAGKKVADDGEGKSTPRGTPPPPPPPSASSAAMAPTPPTPPPQQASSGKQISQSATALVKQLKEALDGLTAAMPLAGVTANRSPATVAAGRPSAANHLLPAAVGDNRDAPLKSEEEEGPIQSHGGGIGSYSDVFLLDDNTAPKRSVTFATTSLSGAPLATTTNAANNKGNSGSSIGGGSSPSQRYQQQGAVDPASHNSNKSVVVGAAAALPSALKKPRPASTTTTTLSSAAGLSLPTTTTSPSGTAHQTTAGGGHHDDTTCALATEEAERRDQYDDDDDNNDEGTTKSTAKTGIEKYPIHHRRASSSPSASANASCARCDAMNARIIATHSSLQALKAEYAQLRQLLAPTAAATAANIIAASSPLLIAPSTSEAAAQHPTAAPKKKMVLFDWEEMLDTCVRQSLEGALGGGGTCISTSSSASAGDEENEGKSEHKDGHHRNPMRNDASSSTPPCPSSSYSHSQAPAPVGHQQQRSSIALSISGLNDDRPSPRPQVQVAAQPSLQRVPLSQFRNQSDKDEGGGDHGGEGRPAIAHAGKDGEGNEQGANGTNHTSHQQQQRQLEKPSPTKKQSLFDAVTAAAAEMRSGMTTTVTSSSSPSVSSNRNGNGQQQEKGCENDDGGSLTFRLTAVGGGDATDNGDDDNVSKHRASDESTVTTISLHSSSTTLDPRPPSSSASAPTSSSRASGEKKKKNNDTQQQQVLLGAERHRPASSPSSAFVVPSSSSSSSSSPRRESKTLSSLDQYLGASRPMAITMNNANNNNAKAAAKGSALPGGSSNNESIISNAVGRLFVPAPPPPATQLIITNHYGGSGGGNGTSSSLSPSLPHHCASAAASVAPVAGRNGHPRGLGRADKARYAMAMGGGEGIGSGNAYQEEQDGSATNAYTRSGPNKQASSSASSVAVDGVGLFGGLAPPHNSAMAAVNIDGSYHYQTHQQQQHYNSHQNSSGVSTGGEALASREQRKAAIEAAMREGVLRMSNLLFRDRKNSPSSSRSQRQKGGGGYTPNDHDDGGGPLGSNAVDYRVRIVDPRSGEGVELSRDEYARLLAHALLQQQVTSASPSATAISAAAGGLVSIDRPSASSPSAYHHHHHHHHHAPSPTAVGAFGSSSTPHRRHRSPPPQWAAKEAVKIMQYDAEEEALAHKMAAKREKGGAPSANKTKATTPTTIATSEELLADAPYRALRPSTM